MRRLYRYLPPFAGDYSGVGSALYELGGMLCIHDASGCTGNYVGFDEPRSYDSRQLVYCTGLRKNDAILGNEEVYIDKIVRAAQEMKPRFIALVGSPVPLIIGFDFKGVAMELENRLGIPAFGFDTGGMKGSYKDGVVLAIKKLMDYYVLPRRAELKKNPGNKKRVNIVGATPLDISSENLRAFRELLEDRGYEVVSILAMENDMEQLLKFYQADVNLAVTQAGAVLAKEMEKDYGMPYLAGVPIGDAGTEHYFRCLKQVLDTGKSVEVSQVATKSEMNEDENTKNTESKSVFEKIENEAVYGVKNTAVAENSIYEMSNASKTKMEEFRGGKGRAVILEDGIIASSIRVELLAQGYEQVDVISLFGKDGGMNGIDAEYAEDEDMILEAVNREDCTLLVGDPILLQHRKEKEGVGLIELPKYAISSKLMHHKRWTYIGEGWSRKYSG